MAEAALKFKEEKEKEARAKATDLLTAKKSKPVRSNSKREATSGTGVKERC